MRYINGLSLSLEISNLAFCKYACKFLTPEQLLDNILVLSFKCKRHVPPYVDLFLILGLKFLSGSLVSLCVSA